MDHTIVSSLTGAGQPFAVISTVILALGVFAPPPLSRATLILAVLVAAAYWVIGEDIALYRALHSSRNANSTAGPATLT